MLMKISATIITAAAIGLFGMSNAVADHGEITGDEIKKVVSGATATGITGRGRNFATKIGNDGSLKVNIAETGFSDTGKWTGEGDNYCSQFIKIRKGTKRCVTVRHLNGNKYLFKAENARTAMTLTK